MIKEEVVFALAFIMGVAYNAIIALRRRRWPGDSNLIVFEVVIGVIAVLLLGSFIRADRHYIWHFGSADFELTNGQSAAWIFFRLFCFAGIPMVAGSLYRGLTVITDKVPPE